MPSSLTGKIKDLARFQMPSTNPTKLSKISFARDFRHLRGVTILLRSLTRVKWFRMIFFDRLDFRISFRDWRRVRFASVEGARIIQISLSAARPFLKLFWMIFEWR